MQNRIREIRKKMNMTQTEFGEALGVSRSVISTYEFGKVAPSQSVLKLLTTNFNVNPYWLETGKGDMFQPKSKNDAISEFMETVMADEEESFRRRFVEMLSALDDDGWLFLESTLKSLYPKEAKEKEQDS